MPVLEWDKTGEHFYETGVDHGVLYVYDTKTKAYKTGVVWNGLTTVTEKPEGAEASPQYADNIKYLNLISAETFSGSIEAFTFPDEFMLCDGTAEVVPGVMLGQQSRSTFALVYRTKVGNDTDGQDHGYKLHILYGCLAAPSERAYATINDSPEAISFSWDVSTTPVSVTGYKPVSVITIDSTKVESATLKSIEDSLFGTETTEATLLLPDDLVSKVSGVAGPPVAGDGEGA